MKNLINLSLKKLKDKKISNPHLDLKIILNYSSKINKEIFLNNIDEKNIDLNKFNNSLKRRNMVLFCIFCSPNKTFKNI